MTPELARDGADGAIDRSQTRDNPRCPTVFHYRCRVRSSGRGNHLSQRSRATASNRPDIWLQAIRSKPCAASCKQRAVHIWAPAFAGVADLIRAMVRHCLMNHVNDSEHLAACSKIAYDCGNSAVLPACREF